jgi:hypothetical protein
MVMMGISLGFANHDDVAANILQPRLPLEEYASLHGF